MIDPLLDRLPCGFVILDDDGTMLTVNTTLADMLGYTRVELEGWHVQKILQPGGRIFYQTHVFPLLKLQNRVEEIYIALRTRAGEDIPVLMNGARRDRDGRVVNDCVFVRMIERHAFEDQILQARRVAEEANAAKSRFLSMMSHDLRTPLTSITGNASLLGAGALGALTGEQLESVRYISEAARELMRMINDILAFAQLEANRVDMKLTAVRIRSAVDRAEALIRLRLQDAALTFRTDVPDDIRAVADPDRLQQVLLNLLTNAIKFTPAGGGIAVSAERDGDGVLVRVRDTGVGIAPDQLERIFEPFVQLGERRGDFATRGIGLGLSISRDLVAGMQGELTADSEVGKGSTFTIRLKEASAGV